jgi:SP family arabinose:H+ symporter-like MFS transporter
MEGWYVSSALVGCISGVIFAGEIADRFGRKSALLLSGLLS